MKVVYNLGPAHASTLQYEVMLFPHFPPRGPRQNLRSSFAVAQMLAAKAYDCYNADLSGTGLAINVPETMWNVPRAEVGY